MKKNIFFLYLVFNIMLAAFSRSSAAEEPAAKIQLGEKLSFCIHVEAIADKDQAQALENKFIQKGYPAYIEETQDNAGKTVYQVRIGKYASRSKAETAARNFYKKEKKAYLITALQSDETTPAVDQAQKADRAAADSDAEEAAEADPEGAGEPSAPETMRIGTSQGEPAAVTRIYTYRGPQGYLCMTNNIEKIPRELQNSVESISVFPVTFVAFNQKKKVLTVEIEKREQDVKLLGVSLSSSSVVRQVFSYCEKNLKAVPLRLKYAPRRDEKKDAPLMVTILLKQGTLINLEIVRLGIAPCAAENLSGQFKKECLEAETAARSSKAGIWAAPADQYQAQ
jgi:hypothetical protein